MLGAHNDLTAVKRLEEQADSGRVAADAANEELRTFAYSIAHDMKAPANTLYSLLNRLSMMMPVDRQAPQRQLMNMSLQTIDRMRVPVDDVLEYTRVVGAETAYQSIDLTNVANEVSVSLLAILRLRVPPLQSIRCQRLMQMQCKCGRSCKTLSATPSSSIAMVCRRKCGCLLVQKASSADCIVLSVQDNGVGIPDWTCRTASSPCSRGCICMMSSPALGLGLALMPAHRCQSWRWQHQGCFDAGCRLHFFCGPADQAAQSEHGHGHRKSICILTPKTRRSSTAILIDDEQVDQILYKMVIDESGLVQSLMSFRYAQEALDYLQKPDRPEIDVIFLDINMPRMTGFEFLEAATAELGASFAKIVVVMLTTSMNPDDEERARQFPVVKEYIHKPLQKEHLERVVELLAEHKG